MDIKLSTLKKALDVFAANPGNSAWRKQYGKETKDMPLAEIHKKTDDDIDFLTEDDIKKLLQEIKPLTKKEKS